MFINEGTKQFMLDMHSRDFGGDVWFLTNIITTYHANEGRYIGMVYEKGEGKLIITLINPTKNGWDSIVEEVRKWAVLKNKVFMYEKQKNNKKEEKQEEDSPKKKGFDWPFGKR